MIGKPFETASMPVWCCRERIGLDEKQKHAADARVVSPTLKLP
jgi:hypothetical protein